MLPQEIDFAMIGAKILDPFLSTSDVQLKSNGLAALESLGNLQQCNPCLESRQCVFAQTCNSTSHVLHDMRLDTCTVGAHSASRSYSQRGAKVTH